QFDSAFRATGEAAVGRGSSSRGGTEQGNHHSTLVGQLLWRPVHPESSSIPFQGSLAGSPPTVIPLRESGLEIKEWRAASYCHLTQSLIALAYLLPLSILSVGSGSESLFPFI
ncbi:hypothetical protein HPG69_019441, partial [Diceros bicornis minor]